MPKKLNLIGQRFGRLVVTEAAPNKGKKTQWKCQCDCGKEYIGTTHSLRSGRLNSCGCLRAETARINGLKQLNDLSGRQFGRLTVLEYAGSHRDRSAWKCQCQCGNIIIVGQLELTQGDTLSCGCLRSSYAETKIEEILQKHKLTYKKEYSFSELLSENGIPLRFDFAVFDTEGNLQYLIEYDGEQHYLTKTDAIWTDSRDKRQMRDKIKNDYALTHHIPLYRIPYWEKNNLNLQLITSEQYLIK